MYALVRKSGLSKEECEKRAKEALELVGFPEELYLQSPFELSGGQKRRAAIAGVLAMRPKVLVLDEPTAGLDPRGRDEILIRLQSFTRKRESLLFWYLTVWKISRNMWIELL